MVQATSNPLMYPFSLLPLLQPGSETDILSGDDLSEELFGVVSLILPRTVLFLFSMVNETAFKGIILLNVKKQFLFDAIVLLFTVIMLSVLFIICIENLSTFFL